MVIRLDVHGFAGSTVTVKVFVHRDSRKDERLMGQLRLETDEWAILARALRVGSIDLGRHEIKIDEEIRGCGADPTYG
jgi:hypothetical protein